jgi:hypothetical protein
MNSSRMQHAKATETRYFPASEESFEYDSNVSLAKAKVESTVRGV